MQSSQPVIFVFQKPKSTDIGTVVFQWIKSNCTRELAGANASVRPFSLAVTRIVSFRKVVWKVGDWLMSWHFPPLSLQNSRIERDILLIIKDNPWPIKFYCRYDHASHFKMPSHVKVGWTPLVSLEYLYWSLANGSIDPSPWYRCSIPTNVRYIPCHVLLAQFQS